MDRPATGTAGPAILAPAPAPGAGVRTLLQGQPPAMVLPRSSAGPVVPRWFYFAADFILVQLAILLVWPGSGRISRTRLAVVAVLILTACLLGIVGCLSRPARDSAV